MSYAQAMCYSAQIVADFSKYRRHGGELDIHAYVQMAGWARQKGTWIKGVPKAMRNAFVDSTVPDEQEAMAVALDAYREAAAALEQEIAKQSARLAKAEGVLAGPKPTKTAENDRRVATNKIAAARAKLAEVADHTGGAEYARIWPGDLTPVLIRDHATGERRVVPMRYRCRLPGWDDAKERAKPGTYNARMDSLSTVWRKLWGYNHGVMVTRRFFESVSLHRLQQRELVPGERDVAVELEFRPEPEQDMLLACLWRYVEPEGDEPGFYSVAAITRDPPPEVAAAGHDRCVIPIKPENLDAWLDPQPGRLVEMERILADPIDAYYEHELVTKDAA
ncbi:SOS response-associated peptidase family protein [Luteibacter aegosomatis]|uniref:SOS response-associated peptidase family protein n=1 Tax=Luteibacter aegosomatis TaxID=2911537 RepID=UPI001FF73275|nr:SOS response-associated peptidase family protein [Luteibacter aegosomatis]UPG86868.1 SOS response-associated peptidase family protein [Luteibacter aegosomatis]